MTHRGKRGVDVIFQMTPAPRYSASAIRISRVSRGNPDFAAHTLSSKLIRLSNLSGVVQLVAHGPLEPRILVRVQAPEPFYDLPFTERRVLLT